MRAFTASGNQPPGNASIDKQKTEPSSPAASTTNSASSPRKASDPSPIISVDKKGLYDEINRLMKDKKKGKSPMTPLGEMLKSAIKKVR